MMQSLRRIAGIVSLLAVLAVISGCGGSSTAVSSYEAAKQAELAQVKAGRFDSGRMWTFDYPPLDYFAEAYGFRPDNSWMEDVRLSSLRMSTGCSAAFVSADGLVMTNHHCSRTALVDIQKDGEKLLDSGFFAETPGDERKVPKVYFDQLVEIRDVTKDVHAVMDAAASDKDAIAARDAKIKEIQENVEKDSKLRAQVVTLYNGGKYSLYLYKRYSDARIVFAPELQAAHFGGEYDNFTYPRYGLDVTFFRLYDDDGKPVKPVNWFEWSKAGAKEDELVFVVGNPGSTNRLSTTEQLEYYRDVQYPAVFQLINDRMEVLLRYSELNPAKRDELRTDLLSMSNSQKAYMGRLDGLRNDVLMARRRDFDRQFKAAVMAKPALAAKYGSVWDDIATTRARLRTVAGELYGLRPGGLGVSDHFSKAGSLVRLVLESAKPDAERQKPYKADAIELTKRTLGKPVSSDKSLEQLVLERQFGMMVKMLGANDPVVLKALQGRPATEAARAMLASTVLGDSLKLAALIAGAPASIEQSDDPFIVLARMAVPRFEAAAAVSNEVSASDQVNRTLLGRALFDVYGTAIPPDATFTLRIADGIVKGYEYNGTKAPAFTTFYGMYDRFHSFPGQEAWHLPQRWQNPPASFNLATPMDFASTNDIIGGNSGSPMINKERQIVGLIFDGNIESLPGDFIFAEDMGNRTVSVHSSGILEAVRHIFKAERVARELESGNMQ